jgi:hypothetical protein
MGTKHTARLASHSDSRYNCGHACSCACSRTSNATSEAFSGNICSSIVARTVMCCRKGTKVKSPDHTQVVPFRLAPLNSVTSASKSPGALQKVLVTRSPLRSGTVHKQCAYRCAAEQSQRRLAFMTTSSPDGVRYTLHDGEISMSLGHLRVPIPSCIWNQARYLRMHFRLLVTALPPKASH